MPSAGDELPLTMRLTLLLLSLCFAGFAGAQTALSLSDAIQQALVNNYQIRLSRANLAVAENNVSDALTSKLPTINLGISPGISYRNNSNPASVVIQSNTLGFGVGPTANLNWTLFNGGRVEINRQRFETLAALSSEQLALQVENSVAEVINAYYAAVVAREQIEVRQRVLELSRDRVRYQQIRAEYGQGGTFDELQAQDAYLTDSTQLVIQRLNYDVAQRTLLQVMGTDDLNQQLDLTTEIDEVEQTYDRTVLENTLLESNRQLSALRVNQRLAAINTNLIETETKPIVSLTAGGGYDYQIARGTQTFQFGDAPPDERDIPRRGATTLSGQLGVGVNYLLYDGGNRSVRAQTAKLEEMTAKLNVDAATQQLRAALVATLDRYENQRQVIAITRSLIDNAERNLEITEERFNGGTINSFDYRAVQLSYVNAEFQLLNALLQLKNTETEIARLTGGVVD